MRIRVALGLTLILLVAVRSIADVGLTAVGLCRAVAGFKDPVAQAEARYRSVRDQLPPRGVYGYRAGGPLTIDRDQEIEGDDLSISRYVLAQYALAPRILDLGPAPAIVIREDAQGLRVTAGRGR